MQSPTRSTLAILTLALMLAHPISAAASTPQAKESAEEASCRKFVGQFYDWYMIQCNNIGNADPLKVALRTKRARFTAELVRRLNEDYAAAAKSPGEIVGLDFDPVLNSQDFAEKYVPGKVVKKGNRYRVEIFDVYQGKRSSIPAVFPELQKQGGSWVFTNFIYKDGSKINDLLSILKQLKAERAKGG